MPDMRKQNSYKSDNKCNMGIRKKAKKYEVSATSIVLTSSILS